ncbi:hypothetical protein JMJ77_0000977, partial [Colletotrichum scovillei]
MGNVQVGTPSTYRQGFPRQWARPVPSVYPVPTPLFR